MVNTKDLALFQRAAGMLCDFSRGSRVRASAYTGTAQVLRWQSRALCETSIRIVAEAERLVAQSRKSLRLTNARVTRPHATSDEARDEGFYWVVLAPNPPEIAYWQRGEWWLAGDPRPGRGGTAISASPRLVPVAAFGPVIRTLERTTDPLFLQAGIRLD